MTNSICIINQLAELRGMRTWQMSWRSISSWKKIYKFQKIIEKVSSPKEACIENWNKYWQRLSSAFRGEQRRRIVEPPKGNWPWLTSSFVALESIDLSRRKTWLSPWDAKSSRQIGLTRLYCPHGTTQIIQPRRRLQIYGKVSCNWGNWKKGLLRWRKLYMELSESNATEASSPPPPASFEFRQKKLYHTPGTRLPFSTRARRIFMNPQDGLWHFGTNL